MVEKCITPRCPWKGVRPFVSYPKETEYSTDLECEKCFTNYDIDRLLDPEVTLKIFVCIPYYYIGIVIHDSMKPPAKLNQPPHHKLSFPNLHMASQHSIQVGQANRHPTKCRCVYNTLPLQEPLYLLPLQEPLYLLSTIMSVHTRHSYLLMVVQL